MIPPSQPKRVITGGELVAILGMLSFAIVLLWLAWTTANRPAVGATLYDTQGHSDLWLPTIVVQNETMIAQQFTPTATNTPTQTPRPAPFRSPTPFAPTWSGQTDAGLYYVPRWTPTPGAAPIVPTPYPLCVVVTPDPFLGYICYMGGGWWPVFSW